MQLITALPLLNLKTPSNILILNDSFQSVINFQIIDQDQFYDWVVVPIFDTNTSEEKKTEAGVISLPNDNDDEN